MENPFRVGTNGRANFLKRLFTCLTGENVMTIRTYIRAGLFLLVSVTLVACGGGGSGGSSGGVSPAALEGQFIDSIVIGLRYETPTESGFTDDQGRFNYRSGETVRFFVGDVFIGEAAGQAIITPVELVAGAVDETNTQVLNIVIFLQSVDDDGDESNGIRITTVANDAAAGQAVDFTLAAGVFDTDGAIQILINSITASNGVARALVPRDQARDAFRGSLLDLFAGDYRGTFAGDDSGSWVATIDASGNITGISTSDTFGADTISGTLSSSGQANISGTVGTAVFSGVFSRNGEAGGSWMDTDNNASGTFTGSRVSVPAPPATGGGNPLTDGGSSGSLMLSGVDSSVIGIAFAPNTGAAVITDPFFGTGNVSVNWNQTLVSEAPAGVESRTLSFLFNENDASVSSVGYLRSFIAESGSSIYSYSLDCGESPQVCASIVLDVVQRQVTFNDTILAAEISGDDNATGSILLNGALSW